MRRTFWMVVAALALAIAAFGCNTNKTLAPKADGENAFGPNGAGTRVRVVERHIKGSAIPAYLRSTWVADNDDVLVKVTVREDETKGDPELMSYLKVLYVCDWIRGRMYGPPGPGHCWDDGYDCTPNWSPDPYTAPHIGDPDGTGAMKADPDADEVTKGDPDATSNMGDPTSDDATAGDPTADDSKADGDGTIVK